MLNKNIETFIGCDNSFDEAKFVLFGAPFDSTASFRPGARFASKTMRAESYGMETYSPYKEMDLDDVSIFDGGDLNLCIGDAETALSQIEKFVASIIEAHKYPVMIGGEHLVTLGAVRALIKKYPELSVIHFDAHADLRDEYLGTKLSHATVMRRVWELTGDGRIYQFGVRSGDKNEFIWGKEHVYMNKFDFNGLIDVIKTLKNKPVYITLDLDVLNPSIFPGTGTPEAGGIGFDEFLTVINLLSDLNIVGFDMVELAPNYDLSGVSTAVACKLLRELFIIFNQKLQEGLKWEKL